MYAVMATRLGVPRDKIWSVPAYMIEDELWIMQAEAAHTQTDGPKRPTQDLMAKDRALERSRTAHPDQG